jgi:hypothetical protein
VNERNLSRRLSTSVVDALKAHGHILVVKGGATALARELDDLMEPEVATIAPRLRPYAPLVGEPTSTFGDETIDQAVEDMVVKLTHALMNSDHVEDVFAEDAVIRRDIFRVVRDGLREPPEAGDGAAESATVTVKLDALGYVAATASRLADPAILRQALDRAAAEADAQFSGFSAELREATFRLEGDGEDEGLELEEAVADELTDLVEHGVVELPTIERRIELARPLTAGEARSLRPRFDAAAQTTLRGSGCAVSWELADARTVRVLYTPFAEHDGEELDAPTAAFAHELATIVAARPEAKPTPHPASSGRGGPKSQKPSSKAAPTPAANMDVVEDEALTPSKRAKATPKAASPALAAAKPAQPVGKTRKPAAGRAVATKAPPATSKPVKPVAAKPAAKRAAAKAVAAKPAKPGAAPAKPAAAKASKTSKVRAKKP